MTTAKIGPDLWLGRIRPLLEREPSDVTIIWDTVLWTNFEPINESKNLFIYKDKKFTACLANAGSRIILGTKYKKGEGVCSKYRRGVSFTDFTAIDLPFSPRGRRKKGTEKSAPFFPSSPSPKPFDACYAGYLPLYFRIIPQAVVR